ncbi:MAG: hypothetical protein IPK21_21050 [Haliscomenobacter sp.]|nr:hypothetical protein [Haliscomenobacter sp.]
MKTIFLLVFLALGIFSLAQECQIKVTAPLNGSTIGPNPITIEGTAKIPPGTHLWALLGKRGFGGWWPQGNGPIFLHNGEWAVDVYAGIKDAGGIWEPGEFYVVFIVVNAQTHAQLLNWVQNAPITTLLTSHYYNYLPPSRRALWKD